MARACSRALGALCAGSAVLLAAAATGTAHGAAPWSARAARTASPHALTTHASAWPARLEVIGRTTTAVVYNDLSHRTVYLANPAGLAPPRVLLRGARAVAVVGDLVEYDRSGSRSWQQLGTTLHGPVPANWDYLAADGGLRVSGTGATATLDYLRLDGSTQSFPLPAALTGAGARYSVAAGPAGAAVIAVAPGGVPHVAFSTLQDPGSAFTVVNTTGLRRGVGLACPSVSGAAIGCVAGHTVVRLATDGRTPPQTSTPAALPLDVAVTDANTSWTASRNPAGTSCPCTLASSDAGGGSVSIVAGLSSGAVISGQGRFYYSAGGRLGRAGVYADLFAGASDQLIAPAAPRPLQSAVPVLGPGRAVWVDDSRATGALWSVRLRADSTAGLPHLEATGVRRGGLAVSGARIAYTGTDGVLRLIDRRGTHAVGRGTLLGLSGTRLAYLTRASRHVLLLDLAHHGVVDETRTLHATTAALFGDYLSYLRPDGSVWRADVGTGAPPVRLAAGTGAGSVGQVYGYGDWTAWSVQGPGGGPRTSAWRDAARLGPARHVAAGLSLRAVGSAGLIVAGGSGYRLLGWSGTTDDPLPGAGPGVPAEYGATVAWVQAGLPTVGADAAFAPDRAWALGAAWAPRAVSRGQVWRLELATSDVLTGCSVLLTGGHGYARAVPCRWGAASSGEVVVRWDTTGVRAGSYRWLVRATPCCGGPLLRPDGTAGPLRGQVVVS